MQIITLGTQEQSFGGSVDVPWWGARAAAKVSRASATQVRMRKGGEIDGARSSRFLETS